MRLRSGIVLLLACSLLLPLCRRETEADQVTKVIRTVQKAAEDKKILTVLEHLSRSYRDPQGNDYDGIKGLLAFYFYRHRNVQVYIPSLDVSVSGTSSSADFEAVLTGRNAEGSPGGIVPDALGVYRFAVQLQRDNAAWKIVSARWERIGDAPGERTSPQ